MPSDSNRDGFVLEVVIPLRDMESHVGPCLEPLLEQCRDGDMVTVVDDGSRDRTASIAAALGARVISLQESRGPYHGRHQVAESTAAGGVVFADGRSRALPGLLEAHRRLLADPGNALSCTNVAVVVGTSLASRVAGMQDMFALQRYVGVPGRPDYFPTCNLGVRASAYRTVGGFRAMRSGGDADLCWRVQAAGLGRLGYEPKTLMRWVTRDAMSDLARQWYRYGLSGADLSALHRDSPLRPSEPAPARPVASRGPLRKIRDDPAAASALVGMELIMRTARLRRRLGQGPRSTPDWPELFTSR